jgi:hypothetical protein
MFSLEVPLATTPNRGLTHFVPLPSSLSHSVLTRAVSADRESLNRIKYPVLAVPIPATYTSFVMLAFADVRDGGIGGKVPCEGVVGALVLSALNCEGSYVPCWIFLCLSSRKG